MWSGHSKLSALSVESANSAATAALGEVVAFFVHEEEIRSSPSDAIIKYDRGKVLKNGATLMKLLGQRLMVASRTSTEKEIAQMLCSRKGNWSRARNQSRNA